jgi:uncharacterized protein YwlG (UPF0340 family)
MSELLLDRAGRRRSPATRPGFHAGHAPGNKGLRYPADPPKVGEIVVVMRPAGGGAHGRRASRTDRDHVAGRHFRLSAGIDSGEIIKTVHARRAPMIPVSASLRL